MNIHKTKTILSVLLAILLMLVPLAAPVAEEEISDATASAESRIGREINYTGGVVRRGFAKGQSAATADLLEVACVLAADPYVVQDVPSRWNVQVAGGIAPYTCLTQLAYQPLSHDQFKDSFLVVESFTQEPGVFEYTFSDEGRYFWAITVTDAAGQFVTFQTRCFETYVQEEETNAQSVAGKVNAVIAQTITDDMSDYRRALNLHDWLVNYADYDITYSNYDAAGVLLYGTGVCDSYARAYQMLLAAAGIDSMIVTGYAGSDANGWEAHSWNLVNLDGLWYHIDCTWDDPVGGTENYNYFCLTDNEIALDHRWNTTETPNVDNAGMFVPEASGGVYSEVETTQDYDFAFSTIAEFEAGLDAQVALGAYTPVVAYYPLGDVTDIQDVLMASLSSKLQEFANMGLLSGSTGISMSGSILTVSIPWANDTSYIRINESNVLLSVGESVSIFPAEVSPAGIQCTVSCVDENIVDVNTIMTDDSSFHIQLSALNVGSTTVTVTTPSGLNDEFTVTVLPRVEPDFNVQASLLGTETALTWNAISGANLYELYRCTTDGDELLLTTAELGVNISNDQISSDACTGLRLVAKRVVGGETLLSYSTDFASPLASLEMDLNLTVYFDSVYIDGYSTAAIAHLSIENYEEISVASGWDSVQYSLFSSEDSSYGEYEIFLLDHSTAEIRLLTAPQTEGDIVLTVTARMGDFSQSVEFPITVANLFDLTITVPERIDTKLGESVALTPLCNGKTNPYLTTDYVYYYSDLITYDYFDPQISAFIFNAENPGITPVYIHIRYSNVIVDARTCLYIADSEGNLPGLEPNIVVDIFNDEFYLNDDYSWINLLNAHVDNYSLFVDLYGDEFLHTAWQLSLGTEQIELYTSDYRDSIYAEVELDNLSYAESFDATLSYTIGRQDDENIYTKTITIPLSIRETPILNQAALDGSIFHTQVGQEFTIDTLSVLPPDWDGPLPSLIFYSNNDAIEYVSAQNGVYTYRATKAGAHQVEAVWQLSNVTIYPTLYIYAADESGVVPVAPELSPTIFLDSLIVNQSSSSNNFADVNLINGDVLTALLGSDYTVEWSTSSANNLFSFTPYTGSYYCYLYADCDTLTATGSEEITVTCTINDDSLDQPQTASVVLTIKIIESPIIDPDLSTLPDEVRLTTGDIWTLDYSTLLPDNTEFWMDAYTNCSGIMAIEYGYNLRSYEMLEPGVYVGEFHFQLLNQELIKKITFYISDENGVIPEPEINLDFSIDENTVYTTGEDHHPLAFFQIANFDDLCLYTGVDSATFSVTGDFADGQHVFEFRNVEGSYAHLYMTSLPSTPGTVELTVTVAMGELTKSVTFPITISDTVPVITLPKWINAQIGQEIAVVPMYNGSENTTFYGEGYAWSGSLQFTNSNEYNVLNVIPQEAGIWELSLHFSDSNLSFTVSTMLVVADENGVAPATSLEPVTTVVMDKVFTTGNSYETIGTVSVDNFYSLHQLYGISDISYTLSSDSDESLGVYEIIKTSSYRAYISMTQLPSQTGTVTLTLTVSAGEEGSDYYETKDIVFTVEVVKYDSSLYSLTLPARIDGQVGQSLSVTPQISIANGDTATVNAAWTADPDIVSCESVSDDGTSYIFNTVTPGITTIEVVVRINNKYISLYTTAYIADEYGNLPTVNIESYENTYLDKLFVDGSDYVRIFNMSVTNMEALAAYYGVDHVDFTLTAPNDERFGLYEFDSYNHYSDSVTLEMIQCPTVTGTFNLIVTATVNPTNGLEPISKQIVIPIQVDEFVPENFTVTLPERTNAQVGVQLAVAPEITAPEGESYRLYGTVTAGDYLRYVFSQDGFFFFDVNNSGITSLSVSVRFRNKDVYTKTNVFIADENGVMPELAPDLRVIDTCQPLYSKDSQTYQTFAQVRFDNLNTLLEFHAMDCDPVWTVTSPAGGPAITTESYGSYLALTAHEPDLPVGTWDIQVDVALGDPETDVYYTDTIIVPLVIEEDPRTEVSLIPSEVETQIGQTFTISKLGFLPADWDTVNPITIEQLNAFDGLELVSITDTEVTFRVISSGIYSMELFWQMKNLVDNFTIDVIAKDENGIVPGSVVEVYHGYSTSETFYVGGTDNMLNSFHISNDNLLSSLYEGEPQWTMTVLNAPDDWKIWPETGSGTSFWLYLDNVPMEPCSIDYRVECVWGEATYAQDFHLDIVNHPDGIPTGLNVQDEYYLQLGETLVLVPEDLILPAGFSTPGGKADAGFGVAPIPSLGDFWDIFSIEYLPNNQIGLTPMKQGAYPIDLTWRFKNILISQRVTLYAANEAGEFISFEPSLEYSSASNVLYAGSNSIDYMVGRVFHENLALYNEINWVYSDPVWSITASEGAPEFYLVHSSNAASVFTASTDMTPGSYEVTVSVELGNKSDYTYKKLSTTFSLEVLENPLSDPIGAGLPDVIHTQIGDSFTVSMIDALPENWDGPAPSLNMFDDSPFIFDFCDTTSLTYTAAQAGVYPVTFFWELANLSVAKDALIYVADEDGNVPMPDLDFFFELRNYQFVNGNDLHVGTVFVDPTLYDTICLMNGSEPEWEVITLEGPGILELLPGYETNESAIYLTQSATTDGTISFIVKLSWGETSFSGRFSFDVEYPPMGIPNGISLPDTLYAVVDEQFTYDVPDVMDPAGWDLLPEYSTITLSCDDPAFTCSYDFWTGSTYYSFTEPGTYFCNMVVYAENYIFQKDLTFIVTPDLDVDFSDAYDAIYAGGMGHPTVFYYVNTDQVDGLKPENSAPLVWTMEVVDGQNSVSFFNYPDNSGGVITLQPDYAETTVIVATLTWGDWKWNYTITVPVQECPAGIPTGLDLPDVMEVAINEPVTVPRSYDIVLPAGWRLDGITPTAGLMLNSGSDDILVRDNNASTSEATVYFFTKPGTYSCTVYLYCANFDLYKDVIFKVADENGNVPEIDPQLELGLMSPLYLEGDPAQIGYANVDRVSYDALSGLIDSDPVYEIIESNLPMHGSYSFGSSYNIYLDEMPSEPCTATFTLRMTWGEYIREASGSIDIIHSAMGAPVLNAPSSFNMKINEPLTITAAEVLANPDWTTGNYDYISLGFTTYGENPFWDNAIWDSYGDSFSLVMTKEGVYDVILTLNCANFHVEQPIQLVVADENGEVPTVELLLEDYLPEYFYLGGSNPSLGQINPPDSIVQTFSKLYDEEPVFEIISSTHPLTATNYVDYYYILSLQEVPTEPGDLSFTVQLTWGDHSVTKSYTIPIVPLLMGLPELNAPDVIYLEVGEAYTLSPETHIQPENWHTGYGDSGSLYVGATSETWEHVSVEFLGSSRILIGSKEGIYDLNVGLEFGNVWLSKNVTLVVTDSTGYFPLPEKMFSLSTTNVTWNKGGNDYVIASAHFDRTAYQICEKLFGCGPEWLDGVDVIPTDDPTHYLIALKDDNFEVGSHSLEVGFVWGHEGISIEMELNVVDPGVTLPESLNIPDEIILAPGDVYSITTEAILPEGWSINGENGLILLSIDNEEESGLNRVETLEDHISIEAVSLGSFNVHLNWVCSNFTLEKNFVITVRESALNISAKQPDYRLLTGMSVQAELTGETEYISTFTWRSNNENVASVDENGVITTRNEGFAVITVEASSIDGMTGSAAFTVTVDASARSMTLPAALSTIENEAFYGTNAQIIYLPEGITTIGDRAFAASSSLWLIRIPASVTEIGNGILNGTDAAILCPAGSPIAVWAEANGIPCYILK